MKKVINSERIEGRIYEHNLVVKKVQNATSENYGKDFISGTIDVATDEDCLNVLQVHFTYVTPTTKKGTVNNTYITLKKIIDEGKTCLADGKDNATKVRIDTALALNDFYGQDGNLVSAKRNEGGFVTILNELTEKLSDRNKFTEDIVITGTKLVEADPEKNIEEDYLIVRGAVFNFRNELLPTDFVVHDKDGIKFFEGLDVSPSNVVFTKIWGNIFCTTTQTSWTEESAFGEAAVHYTTRTAKEWVITGSASAPYDFGDEEVMTADDLKKAMQDREVKLAEIKKNADDYKAAKAASTDAAFSSGSVMNMPISGGTFNF